MGHEFPFDDERHRDGAAAGAGTVTSIPAGIDCGTKCSAGFATGTQVTLTATPASGSLFAGWSGGGCSGTGTCTVSMSSNQTVTATFSPARPVQVPPGTDTLTVAKAGSGAGTVTSSPAGIDCGGVCGAAFASGQILTLTATPAPGSGFASWSGACTGSAPACALTLSTDQTATATFQAEPLLSKLTLSQMAFRAATSGPSALLVRRHSDRGTIVRFALGRPATVRFTIELNLAGRKTGKGKHAWCVAATKHNRSAPRCTRTVTLHGSFTISGKAGANSFRFTGRIGGHTLRPGSYT